MMRSHSILSMYKPVAGLAAVTLLVAACASSPTTSRVEKSLEQTTPTRQTVATTALAQVGDAYATNMAGPNQYDDAGLAYYAYRQNGRALPRALSDQLDAGQPIALSEAQPGDLVFLRLDAPDGSRLTVGVLAGANLAVLAMPGTAQAGGGVRRVSLADDYWRGRFVGVSRILPQAGAAR
ncbi:glycoside hydrolase [Salinisphaera japonica YTM-1]|uniref:Glycoside hydrolase n=2 Tax=Salinisphaera TaxID=180541 RepID=A0A423PZX4_9GAMM|nr:glycoside hydrolase [Salinisphaera japonica YTM-1]